MQRAIVRVGIAICYRVQPMPVVLRPALKQDFDYCGRLYFGEMQWIIDELHLDPAAHEIRPGASTNGWVFKSPMRTIASFT